MNKPEFSYRGRRKSLEREYATIRKGGEESGGGLCRRCEGRQTLRIQNSRFRMLFRYAIYLMRIVFLIL